MTSFKWEKAIWYLIGMHQTIVDPTILPDHDLIVYQHIHKYIYK